LLLTASSRVGIWTGNFNQPCKICNALADALNTTWKCVETVCNALSRILTRFSSCPFMYPILLSSKAWYTAMAVQRWHICDTADEYSGSPGSRATATQVATSGFRTIMIIDAALYLSCKMRLPITNHIFRALFKLGESFGEFTPNTLGASRHAIPSLTDPPTEPPSAALSDSMSHPQRVHR
jgi:hypothetical protein